MEWCVVVGFFSTLSLHDANSFDHLDFGIVASLQTRYFIFKFDFIFLCFLFIFVIFVGAMTPVIAPWANCCGPVMVLLQINS